MAGWSEQNLRLGDVKLRFLRGGSGRPVLVLHHDIGTPTACRSMTRSPRNST